MKTFTKDDGSAMAIIDQLAKLFYPDIGEAQVSFEVLHASGGLTHQGYSAAATVKVNGLKDRAAGCADVRIIVDGDGWDTWDRKRRQAVLDHELYHIDVQRDDEGHIKSDDLGRPKIKLKLHDHQIGVFEEVISRNKEFAVDAQVFAKAYSAIRQLEFDWDAAEAFTFAGSDELLA